MAAAATAHPQVQAAQARVDAAAGARRTAGTWTNPVFTHWIENASFSLVGAPTGLDREASTYGTVPLEPLFQRAPRMRRADRDVDAARAEVTTVQRQVSLEAARAFFRVALSQIVADTEAENRAALDRLAEYNRARVSQGAIAEVELLRVQIEIDRAVLDLAVAQAELARAQVELRRFLGAQAAGNLTGLRVATGPAAFASQTPLAPLASLIAQARTRRPELTAARARIEAAGAETEYQRRLFVRQLGASVGFKQSAGRSSLIAGISLPLPLFDRNAGEVQRVTAERVAAEHDMEAASRLVETEVEASYETARQLSAALDGAPRTLVDRAADLRRLTLAAYQEGGATLLQVLDATRTLSDARVTYFRAAFAARQGLIELLIAAGDDPLQNRTK
ncbi:MAG TPA: TolC family protein [Vicinamibacterales bacterium]|nr:TolC family protein [Vicinamibacterales bacterium]